MSQALGELSKQEKMARIIRVNHAGEYGAKRIYAGQLAVLGKSSCGDMLRHMAAQEQEHLDYFADEMVARRVRPTALMPFWHIAGWALGAGTALLGEKAAMACTVAVEAVIGDHYAEQEGELNEEESALRAKIHQFREEELEHHDSALEHGAEKTPLYGLLTKAISMNTKLAIWLAKRV